MGHKGRRIEARPLHQIFAERGHAAVVERAGEDAAGPPIDGPEQRTVRDASAFEPAF
jgi:hypothetical protein